MQKIHDGSQGLVMYQGKLLLLLRDERDTRYPLRWCLIGGGAEEGENPEQTLLREIQEEISITPRQVQFLFERDNMEEPDKSTSIFYVPLDKDEADKISLGNEGLRLEFFDLDKISELPVVPSLEAYLPKYREYLNKVS